MIFKELFLIFRKISLVLIIVNYFMMLKSIVLGKMDYFLALKLNYLSDLRTVISTVLRTVKRTSYIVIFFICF